MNKQPGRINVGIAREVVRRFRAYYPSVTLSEHIRLWLLAEIERAEKSRERIARNDPFWPELPPAAGTAEPDPAAIFAD